MDGKNGDRYIYAGRLGKTGKKLSPQLTWLVSLSNSIFVLFAMYAHGKDCPIERALLLHARQAEAGRSLPKEAGCWPAPPERALGGCRVSLLKSWQCDVVRKWLVKALLNFIGIEKRRRCKPVFLAPRIGPMGLAPPGTDVGARIVAIAATWT